jgi:hypothetical protein
VETKPSVIARYSSSKVAKEFFLENYCYFIRFCLAPQSVAKTLKSCLYPQIIASVTVVHFFDLENTVDHVHEHIVFKSLTVSY